MRFIGVEIIRKKGNQWCLYSKSSNRNLGCFSSLDKAKKRERQVQYFKRQKSNLTDEDIIRFLKDNKDLRYV